MSTRLMKKVKRYLGGGLDRGDLAVMFPINYEKVVKVNERDRKRQMYNREFKPLYEKLRKDGMSKKEAKLEAKSILKSIAY